MAAYQMALLHPSSVPNGRSCRFVAVVAACLLLLSGSCDAARRLHQEEVKQSPWSYIKSTPGLEILASLVQAANLTSALDSVSLGYTLFLPNNQSFSLLASEQGITVAALKNSSALRGVLLYHVFPGAALSPDNLTIGKRLLMGSGDNISITQAMEIGLPLGFSDAMGRVAAPVTSNITLGSSVGYIINRIMLPITPSTIDEALSYESGMSQIHEVLRAMAASEGGDDKTFTSLLYSNTTNVTFLVPTNDAFSAMCINITDLFNNTDYLKKMLLSHFLNGSLDFADLSALNGANITTLNPEAKFLVQVMYGTIVLYGNNVSSTLIMTPNLVAGKSILHSINTILVPSDPNKPTFSCPPAPPNDDYAVRNSFYYEYPTPSDVTSSPVPADDSSTWPSEDSSDSPSAH